MNKEEINAFEILQAQIESLYDEMQTLVKKSPGDAVNKFKLQLINALLQRGNMILGETRKPFPSFHAFDGDELPTNSDILMMISQYLSALETMRTGNIASDFGGWYWLVDGVVSEIRTRIPRKLSK